MLHKIIIDIALGLLSINLIYAQEVEYKTYNNIPFGFRIDYPSDWFVEEQPYYSYIKVSFVANVNDTDYRPFLLVGYEELKEDMSYDDYKQLILEQQLRALNNFTLTDESDTIFANNTARMLVFEGIDVDIYIKGKIVYTILNNTVYSIITAARFDDFDSYEPIFDDMINSFRIDKSIIPKPISKGYEDDSISIKFPEGWQGLISKVDEDVIIRLMPDPRLISVSNIVITNLEQIRLFNEQIKDLFESCKVYTTNFIEVNGSKALELEQECEQYRNKLFIFATDNDKLVLIDLTSIKEEYNQYIDKFYTMLSTLKINATDITQYLDEPFKDLPIRLDSIDEFDVPEGWSMFKKDYDGIDIIYATPDGSNIIFNYTMIALIKAKPDLDLIVNLNKLYECNISTIHYISSSYAFEYSSSCSDGKEVRTLVFDDYAINYLRYSSVYDDIFKDVIDSLDIDDSLKYSINAMDYRFNDNIKNVEIDGNKYDIEYSYQLLANVDDITFDEESKSITIKAEADRLSILKVKPSILEGPYIVKVNGSIVDIDANNTDILAIAYDGNADIEIIGSKVVPEFPLPLLLISIIGISIIFARYKGKIHEQIGRVA